MTCSCQKSEVVPGRVVCYQCLDAALRRPAKRELQVDEFSKKTRAKAKAKATKRAKENAHA